MVFQEFLTRKEDYLRALRGFLREVIRQVRNEFNFSAFTRSLMQEIEFTQLDPAHKVRVAWFTFLWGGSNTTVTVSCTQNVAQP